MNEGSLGKALRSATSAQEQMVNVMLKELAADRAAVRAALADIDAGEPVATALARLRARMKTWEDPAAPANDGGRA